MRSYPKNSPEATARIIALMMLADGHACESELDLLDHLPPDESLGISRDTVLAVTSDLCQDMHACGQLQWTPTSGLDASTIKSLMAEIDDPSIRQKLLKLCESIVAVDHHEFEGELLLLGAAAACWGMQRETRICPD